MNKLSLLEPGGTYRDFDGSRRDYDRLFTVAKATDMVLRKPRTEIDRGPERSFWVRLPAGTDPARAADAVRYTVGGSRCQCMHDCCGCPTVHVSVARKTRRDLLVRTRITYNY